jgi:hypothetical protein
MVYNAIRRGNAMPPLLYSSGNLAVIIFCLFATRVVPMLMAKIKKVCLELGKYILMITSNTKNAVKIITIPMTVKCEWLADFKNATCVSSTAGII